MQLCFVLVCEHKCSASCLISVVIDSHTESSFGLCWQLTLYTMLHRGRPEDCADMVLINHLLVINTDNGFKVTTLFGIF